MTHKRSKNSDSSTSSPTIETLPDSYIDSLNKELNSSEGDSFMFPEYGKVEGAFDMKTVRRIQKNRQTYSPELRSVPLINLDAALLEQSLSSPQQPTEEEPANLFEKGAILAAIYGGECLSNNFSLSKGKEALKFRCLNQHCFFIPIDDLKALNLEGDEVAWCPKCVKFYHKCEAAAAQVGLAVVGGLYEDKITLKCGKRGHVFTISY